MPVGAAHQQACDMATRFGAGQPGPLEGAQPEWDGTGQAPHTEPHITKSAPGSVLVQDIGT